MILTAGFLLNAQPPDYPNDVIVNTFNEAFYENDFSLNTRTFGGQLVITSGVVFNLQDAELLFASGKGIVILQGAVVDIAGYTSSLSNHNLSGNADWHGVEVYGTSTSNLSADQGKFLFKNGTISNAEVGVSNYDRSDIIFSAPSSGGIIQIADASMINCKQQVKMAKYIYPIQTYFKEVDFLWDATGPYAMDQTFNPMIQIYWNSAVPFERCNFHNTNTNIFFSGSHIDKAAIYAYGSGTVHVTGNASLAYSFEGFKYGVVGVSTRPSIVRDMQFNCYRGIWFRNMYSAEIVDNRFEHIDLSYIPFIQIEFVPGSSQNMDNQYGIYLEDCTNFDVSENVMDFPDTEERENGIFVNSSGSNNNLIFKNVISHCAGVGITCIEDNRNNGGSMGLKLECNELLDCYGGIFVWDDTPAGAATRGIHNFQGTQIPGGFARSAGNYFGSTGGVFSNNDPSDGYHIWNVDQDVGHVFYYYLTLENLQEWDGDIDAYTLFNGSPVQENLNCVYGIAELGEDPRAGAMQSKEAMLLKQEELEAVVDGGDTEGLTMEVILTEYGEALELYYELMAASPNLSKEVIIEAILKEAELPTSLLTLILQSNPVSATSSEVQERLDQRAMPLSEYQRYMIDQAIDIYSEKRQLERELDYHRFLYDLHLNKGIQDIMAVDTLGLGGAQVEALIEGIARPVDLQFLASYALSRADYEPAISYMDQVSTDFDLDPAQLEEHEDLLTCMMIEIALSEEERVTLTEDELIVLEAIGEKVLGRANGHALSLLERYTDYVHHELFPTEEFDKSGRSEGTYKPEPSSTINVYPSPASDFLMIDSQDGFHSCHVTITDMLGKQQLVVYMSSAGPIDVRDMEAGSYVLTVYDGVRAIHSQNILISR